MYGLSKDNPVGKVTGLPVNYFVEYSDDVIHIAKLLYIPKNYL